MRTTRTVVVAACVVALIIAAVVNQSTRTTHPLGSITAPTGCALARSASWEFRLKHDSSPGAVIIGPDDTAAMVGLSRTASLAEYNAGELAEAPAALSARHASYTPANSDGFLTQGRQAILNTSTLYYAYTATRQPKYRQYIKQDALHFSTFPDWGKSNFLGAAEIATAVAYEYSLAQVIMTPAERATVTTALITKALAPASCLWEHDSLPVTATYNWGVVTNAGMILAALATQRSSPELSAAVIARALPLANRAIAGASDGGSPEGPAYADYIDRYTAYLIASFSIEFGRAGLGYIRPINNAATYWNAVSGTTGRAFNYADSNPDFFVPLLPALNARLGGDPLGRSLAQQTLDRGPSDALLLLWFAETIQPAASRYVVDETFPVSGIAVMRSASTPSLTWLGIKGGSNSANHAHLDLGSFVLEMQGVRFVSDLGADNYALLDYFGSKRFSYARTESRNHSTVTTQFQNQPVSASAPIPAIVTDSGGAHRLTLNLAQALRARSAVRQFTMTNSGAVAIIDVARYATPTEVDWTIITSARIVLADDRRSATLTLAGKSIVVALRSSGGVFAVSGVNSSPAPGYSNSGFTKLTTTAQATKSPSSTSYQAEISVTFTSS